MDRIDFVPSEGRVSIFINGRNFVDMLREYELPFATAEGHPSLAGKYTELPITGTLIPSKHFLGKPQEPYGRRHATYVLICECGEPDCWPFVATIEVTDAQVIWSGFVQPHRGSESKPSHWKYDKFGPFRFDRQQYESALRGKPEDVNSPIQ